MNRCSHPKNISNRASKLGNDLMDEFYERCLNNAKKFNHIKHRYEVDVLEETECHVMKKQISILWLDKMTKQFKEHEQAVLDLANQRW